MSIASDPKRERTPLNAEGDSYVEAGTCLLCMAPENQAPELMGFKNRTAASSVASRKLLKKSSVRLMPCISHACKRCATLATTQRSLNGSARADVNICVTRFRDAAAVEQIVGRERRERVSQLT
jgi:hypothetical protein